MDSDVVLPPAQCERLMANEMLVVAPDHGFVWCPNAKVGTTTWYEILRRRLTPQLHTLPRCFPMACPDKRGGLRLRNYPLLLPKRMPSSLHLCDRRRFVSFTFVRNPWDRLASAYLSKISRPTISDRQALAVQNRIRILFGLRRSQRIAFGHFIRWVVQQNASTMNQHWKPHSERCDTLYTPFEFIGRYETMQEDILHVLGMLGWSPTLIPSTHWSSLDRSAFAAMRQNESEKLLALYNDDETSTREQLVELVAYKVQCCLKQIDTYVCLANRRS